MRQQMRQTVLYSILVPCLASVPTWGAQSEDPGPMLEFRCAGLYGWSVSEKDQRFFDATKLLRDRLMDLAIELDLEPFQGQAMVAGWDLLNSNTALRLEFTENGPSASMVFEPGSNSAESLYIQMTGFADMAELGLSELSPTSSEMMGPAGPIVFAHDDSKVWLSMGDGDVVSMDIPQGDLPAGVTPMMFGHIDIGTMIEMFAPPEFIEEFIGAGESGWNPLAGFLGPDAPVIVFGVGADDHSMHMTSRLIGAKESMAAMGMSDEFVFEANHFGMVPQDTVRLSAFQTNIESTLSMIQMVVEEEAAEEYAEFTQEIGVDLINDLFGNLGNRAMFYQSESTGGGGLLSAVMLFELNDSAEFNDGHAKIVERLNDLAASEADGYVRVQGWDVNGVNSFSITTPGLPIPIEPSWSIMEDVLVVALSPGALEVAVNQVQSKGTAGSLLDNQSFQDAVVSRMPNGEAHSVSYFDSARLVKKGYGLTSMFTSALANAARSPANPERVLGSIMPNYVDFTTGVAPSGNVNWWDGDDFRSHYIGDESILVQLSAGLGAVADVQGLVVPALAVGILLPALGQAQERANELKSATVVRSIAQGIVIHASGNNEEFPDSLQTLVDEGSLFADMLESPFGHAPDGGADYAIRIGLDYEKHMFDARCVIAIDRAMVLNGSEFIPVAFADVHVEAVDIDELIEILSWPENKGAAEAFDIHWFLENGQVGSQENRQSFNRVMAMYSLMPAIITYSESEGEYPDSVKVLADLVEPSMLESPYGPTDDGFDDIVIRKFTTEQFNEYLFDTSCVLAIDRAMLVGGMPKIVVVIADGHAELMPIELFFEYLEMPANASAREDFGIEGYYLE